MKPSHTKPLVRTPLTLRSDSEGKTSPSRSARPGTIWLTIPMDPPTTTAQMKRLRFVNGKPRFFHDKKLTAEADGWGLWLRKHAPPVPFDGPVFVRVSFEYPHTQASKKRGALVPKVSRPDVDGAVKHLIDAMQGAGYFQNDAQVQRLEVSKWHGDQPAIDIHVGPVVDNTSIV